MLYPFFLLDKTALWDLSDRDTPPDILIIPGLTHEAAGH